MRYLCFLSRNTQFNNFTQAIETLRIIEQCRPFDNQRDQRIVRGNAGRMHFTCMVSRTAMQLCIDESTQTSQNILPSMYRYMKAKRRDDMSSTREGHYSRIWKIGSVTKEINVSSAARNNCESVVPLSQIWSMARVEYSETISTDIRTPSSIR